MHNRAQWFFLGVGKYTPNDGISGDIGWNPPVVRQWKTVSFYWSRLASMSEERVNNWVFNIRQFFNVNDLHMYDNIEQPLSTSFVSTISGTIFNGYVTKWFNRINSDTGPSRRGGNKIRLYKCVKSDFEPEYYCKLILPPRHRSAFSKFRFGVAPIRIETGRYEGLSIDERLCPFCDNVENEYHVLFHCAVYNDIREHLFNHAIVCNAMFMTLSDNDKFNFLFSNSKMIRTCAKTCYHILQRRLFLNCK